LLRKKTHLYPPPKKGSTSRHWFSIIFILKKDLRMKLESKQDSPKSALYTSQVTAPEKAEERQTR
jgi:hypothetical protein